MSTPLHGLTVIELAGIGPGPHASMILADLGAEVVRVARPESGPQQNDHTLRGRKVVEVDLKSPAGPAAVLELVRTADVLVEGFRPGVAERLGVGPEHCHAVNPRLVYARITGWGQYGPLAPTAGHDINYLALTGALEAIGTPEAPVPPLNVVADNGGGSLFAVTGLLAALWERERTGEGSVVDAAMVDGVEVLSQQVLELRAQGQWGPGERGRNLLDGGAPYYRTYRCLDGRFVAVGAIEPQFWQTLMGVLGLDVATLPDRDDPAQWDALAAVLAARFAERDRDHWAALCEQTDACLTPVLAFDEAVDHPHIRERRSLTRVPGGVASGTAPRISRRTTA